jgi:putative membrane protein
MKMIIALVLMLFAGMGYMVSLLGFPSDYAWVSNLFIVIMALPAFIGVIKLQGLKRGLAVVLSLMLFALIFEGQAIYTGFPYSEFNYSDKIEGKLFGIVPWTIGFAWAPLLIGSAIVVTNLKNQSKFLFIIFTSILLVLVDLVLDPGATKAGLWIWENTNGFYGVPLMNFFGWFVSGIFGASIYLLLVKNPKNNISKIDQILTTGSLSLTLAFWSGAAIFFGMWIVFILGIGLSTYLFIQNHYSRIK